MSGSNSSIIAFTARSPSGPSLGRDAQHRRFVRLAHEALGAEWRTWLSLALSISKNEADEIASGAIEPSSDAFVRLNAYSEIARGARVHEIVTAIVQGLEDDGVPSIVLAANLASIAKALQDQRLD